MKKFNHEIHKLTKVDTSYYTDNHLTIIVPKDMLNENWHGGDMLIEYVRNESTDLWAVNVRYNGSYHAHNIRNPFWHFNDMIGVLKLVPGFMVEYWIRDEDEEIQTVITVPRSMILMTCADKRIVEMLKNSTFRSVEFYYEPATREQRANGVDPNTVFLTVVAKHKQRGSNVVVSTYIYEELDGEDIEHFNRLRLTVPLAPGFQVNSY
jgi:hypothetical protein